jgi:glyoxylase-like metal-dependent hydrolase (beta-lactamase superfamily II)
MARIVDLMHLGRDRVIGAWIVDGVVIDPGPASGLDRLLEDLAGEEPRALLITHVHLDHAGAAGALVRRFPRLRVYVHELGAPHLEDPSRLVASASRLYGADLERMWGQVVPVPKTNLIAMEGGETVEGFGVAYTPGHASHHVCFFSEATGDAFVGDVAGVTVPPSDLPLPPTPPPDIDLEAWDRSLDTLLERAPQRVCITHFGAFADVEGRVHRMREFLARLGELARHHGEEAFLAAVRSHVTAHAHGDEGVVERYLLAAPPDLQYAGLERYWRRRAEAARR